MRKLHWSAGITFRGYESCSYVKVIGSRSRSQEQKREIFLLPQCKTSIGNSTNSIEDEAMKFEFSMGFSVTADRMMWLPSLSRDRK